MVTAHQTLPAEGSQEAETSGDEEELTAEAMVTIPASHYNLSESTCRD